MVETIEKDIKDRVFTKTDLRNIWSVFETQEKPHPAYVQPLTLQIRCSDGTRYEGDDDELLRDGSIIDLKKVETVNFRYSNSDRSINVSLTHGETLFSNSLSITGNDHNWLSGTFSKMEDIFNAAKPQDHWFLKYKELLSIVATVIFGFTIFEIVHFTIGNHEDVITYIKNSSFSSFLLVMGLAVFFGYILSTFLIQWLSELWPRIEFAFGPAHLQYEKERRNRLGILLTALIIPFLFSLIPLFL